MIVKATHVIGLPVYTIQQGQQLEHTVKDVAYDPNTNRVEALVLDEGGWFSDAQIILIRDVHSIGEDAVLIENPNVIKKASEVKQKVASIAKGENYLTTDKVITENGTDLGTIDDLLFDTKTGNVQEFEVSQGTFKDVSTGKKIFKPNDIITVGQNAIIVSAYTEKEFEKQARKKGAVGMVSQSTEKTAKEAPSLLSQAKQAVQRITEEGKEKIEEVRESPKTQESIQNLKERAAEVKDTTQQRIQQEKRAQEEKRKKDTVGKYLTINILSQKDKILAKRGDMITHDLLEKAEKNDVLEQVINNTTNEPLETKKRQKKSTSRTRKKDKPQKVDAIFVETIEEVNTPIIPEFGRGPMQGALGGKAKNQPKEKSSTPTKSKSKTKK